MPVISMETYNAKRKEVIRERVQLIKKRTGLKEVVLRILTDGQFPQCQSYLKSKILHGGDCDIKVDVITITTIEELERTIQDSIDNAIPMIFQLPSRKEFEDYYMNKMKEYQHLDMDGFFDGNALMKGDYTFAPCTPKGVIDFVENGLKLNLKGKNVVVVGRGKLVGLPLSVMMINAGATVTVINSRTKEDIRQQVLEMADLVVLATGVKGSVADDELAFDKPVYVINVGTVFDENGKLDTELEVVGIENVLYTARIKAVGIATVISLIENTCNFYEKYK